ncbi:hypothetical protein [Vibrio nigripulchritudo]|uniref:hypothetical protein n=1 Tax=Vibrio nigripulchritudo TaxID=28173 RepID=UPI00248F4C13|nr:hypothetical protein [Vibrio nigripulchritudo]BDU37157.1 hypothetical protein TUMSATVNIG2_16260 [Vibrio nigripulchritudo]BDU37162.1 hypothetical protein TUMSATVNIG2_16310 [Vibrio nigripulchritudo]BDU42869.1 hypothetical protein TUMSATVNIG3_16670 [Vibrio nigripulchritudo]BDU42874.1 hypothetical protein TUMSATVNIG3_16720 [Vibrio nigripulchritudo]
MSELQARAERIKEAIKAAGGYEHVSECTGINLRTLKRIAAGQTDPRFSDVIEISRVTGIGINHFVHGDNKIERIGEAFEDIPDLMLKAFVGQQRQTEQIINQRLEKLERLIGKFPFSEHEKIHSAINEVTTGFKEEAHKETESLIQFGELMREVKDVAEEHFTPSIKIEESKKKSE